MSSPPPHTEPGSPARRSANRFHAAVVLLAALVLAGCASEKSDRLGDYLDALEFDAPLASVANVKLGKFDVPVPAQAKVRGAEKEKAVWIRVSFELFAETPPENEQALRDAADANRGALNDALLTVLRTSSADELTDPRSSSLKTRMTEAVRPLLGDRHARQLILHNLQTELL